MRMGRNFEVVVKGFHSSAEEWKQLLDRDGSVLKALSPEEMQTASRLGVPAEEYARAVASGQAGRLRLESRGEKLGNEVAKLLSALGDKYKLEVIEWAPFDMGLGGWKLRISSPEKIVNVIIPRDLADDVIDSPAVGLLEELKKVVVSELRPDLLRG
jgi:hypothetical protein